MPKMNERKMKILEAVISEYITTAEPIGSRTIAKRHDFGLSSATIRNEMSDLEEMGYVVALHASSGRVPSNKGYRLYVDNVMKKRRLTAAQKEHLAQVLQKDGRMDNIMREIAQAVSFITNYTIIATEPLAKSHKVRQIQLIVIEGPIVAVVIITDQNAVKNKVVVLPNVISQGKANRVSEALTALLQDSMAEDFTPIYAGMLRHRFKEMDFADVSVDVFFAAIREALYNANIMQIHTIGIKKILDFPEFSDLDKARAIVGTLEEKENLYALLGDMSDSVRITIGEENDNASLKECSIIRARISINNQMAGNIAIIGPTRMDYAQVVAVLQSVLSTFGIGE